MHPIQDTWRLHVLDDCSQDARGTLGVCCRCCWLAESNADVPTSKAGKNRGPLGGRWAAVGLLGRHQDEAHLEAYVNSHKLATRIPSSVDGQVTDFQRFEHVFGNSDLGFRAARIGSNKKLVVTSASLLVTSALLVKRHFGPTNSVCLRPKHRPSGTESDPSAKRSQKQRSLFCYTDVHSKPFQFDMFTCEAENASDKAIA